MTTLSKEEQDLVWRVWADPMTEPKFSHSDMEILIDTVKNPFDYFKTYNKDLLPSPKPVYYIKKHKDYKSVSKAMKDAKKKEEAWKKLIVGDDPYDEKCGEPWDEWNTVHLPELRRKRHEKEIAKLKKVIAKNDVDGDGQLNMLDMMCDYNCHPINKPIE